MPMPQEISMFHTPRDWNELQSWIEEHPPEDRAHLYTAAIMAWNLAASIVSKEYEGHSS